MNSNVKILMATYNGEKFIEEQIRSILNQSYEKFELIIRDDCSNDNTVLIIKNIMKNDERIKLIVGTNLGQTQNFNELLKNCDEADYIMFADQDDIWIKDKIKISLEKIKECEEKYGKDKPILVYSDLKYVDEKLNPIKSKKLHIKKEGINILLGYNYIWGCTTILNRVLVEKSFPISNKAQNHDYWIALHAELFGKIVHIKKETILYRQHSNNVTGGISNYSIISKVKRIKLILKAYEEQIEQNILFCKKYSGENYNVLNDYLNIFNSPKVSKINKMIEFGLRRSSLRDSIMYYFYIIFIFRVRNKYDNK